MTREHKLALIVGFSLILLVGVLISDHLSRARQAQVGPVTTHEAQVGEANFPAPIDPIKAIENAPRPANVPQLMPERQLAGATPADGGSPALSGSTGAFLPDQTPRSGALTDVLTAGNTPAGNAPTPPIQEPTQPKTTVQIPKHELHIPKAQVDQDLIREVLAQGGQVRERNGIVEIVPAAQVQAQKPAGKSDVQVAKAGVQPPVMSSAASLKTYTIQKGDNLTKLAAKEYGDSKLWARLAKYNGITDEDGTVQLGQSIKLPPKDLLLGKPAAPAPGGTPVPMAKPGAMKPRIELASKTTPPAPAKAPGKNKTLGTQEPTVTVTVKKGETLGDVAKRALGSAKRWPELAEFNKIDDEDNIAAGTVLKVPPMRG